MGYFLPMLDYKQAILLPDGSYKGILETDEGWLVQDLHKGTNFGIYGSLEKALVMAHAYGLNLLHSAPEVSQSDNEGIVSTPSMATPTETPKEAPDTQFADYCEQFANPKNKSGYKFIVDQTESTGWVILKEGRSEYERYSTVQEALEEAYKVGLNLK